MRNHILGRAALAGWCAFTVYCTLSILFGPAGIVAYRALDSRVALMRSNIVELGRINESLEAEVSSLKSDPTRAVLEARALGYLDEGETAIVLQGITGQGGGKLDLRRNVGEVLRAELVPPLADKVIKEIALIAGLLTFGLGLALGLSRQEARGGSRVRAPN